MFTSYLTNKNYLGLSALYAYDDQVDFLTKRISIDGYLTTSYSPVFSGNNDFFKSNYSLIYLTNPTSLKNVTDFIQPQKYSTHYFCNLYNRLSGVDYYLTFTDDLDDTLINTIIYDQTVNGKLSSINDLYYFDVDLTDPVLCTISHNYRLEDYFLSFNPASLNINFAIASSFNAVTNYNRQFYYTYNPNDKSLSFQVRIGGLAYQVIRDIQTKRLALCAVDDIAFTDTRGVFYLTAFQFPSLPEVTIDWGSYLKTYNQNNIDIDTERSFYDINSNFLVHSEYFNLEKEKSALKTNILPLKTQLNIKNLQGRGNTFVNDTPVNYRNYVSIFGGNRQEKGYEKLHLQYECYSTPFTFKSGQTTWFHMPQDMYPYSRLNIKNSKLIDSGAVGGDHPLRSDKVFKKLGEYKYTSNLGDPTGEATGQWLCAWLSAGPDISIKPVWVDRFYNPVVNTPFQAMAASEGNVTYIPSYECYNLGLGIVDVPSNLTFEPGSLYAYSHIGRVDAEQNIKALLPFQQQKNLTTYSRYDGLLLDPRVSSDRFSTYTFNGDKYGTINVNNFDLSLNTFTISFWANRNDWTKAIGYQLAGNYNEYGAGIFNYKLVTPTLFYLNGFNIVALNRDLETINNFDNLKPFNQRPQYYLRRDPLNAFHVITNSLTVGEINLQETLVDAITAAFNTPVKDVTNDQESAYVLFNNNTLSGIDLTSNLAFKISASKIVSHTGSYSMIRQVADQIILIDGEQGAVRGTGVYFLSSGVIRLWDTQTQVLTTVLGRRSSPIACFGIDKNSNFWTASGNSISVYGEYQQLLQTTTLTADSSFTATRPNILNITFIENFISGDLYSDVIVAASGSKANKLIVSRFNYQGKQEKTVLIDANPVFNKNLDPSNHNFNYAYVYDKVNGNNNYSFKLRLFNQFNTEDIEIPETTILSNDLNPGYHHFAFVVNTVNGYVKSYLDGDLYETVLFTPKKYSFVPLIIDRILVGACPFYSGILLSTFLRKSANATDYFVKDLELQNFYIHNKELNYFDIGMLYKEKEPPTNLIWDVPSGKRHFIETISRYFTQKVPGAKSTLYNIFINDNLLDKDCRDYLEVAIIKKLKDITPAYTKLNKLSWVTNLPAQSAEYLQPFFPGNTITNAGLAR